MALGGIARIPMNKLANSTNLPLKTKVLAKANLILVGANLISLWWVAFWADHR